MAIEQFAGSEFYGFIWCRPQSEKNKRKQVVPVVELIIDETANSLFH